VAAVPGYALAVWRMDRIGHRRLQLVGFIVMGACFAVIGLVPGMTTAVAPFLLAHTRAVVGRPPGFATH
jgi:PHS family inorganic phosphate transporter-like MFS transporter